MKSEIIQNYMVRYPHVMEQDQTVADAREFMTELGIRHLPVVDCDKLVGIISDRDLRAALNLPEASNLTLADIMKRNIYAVPAHTPIANVAIDMAEDKFGSAIVVDSSGEMIGIFTTTDALRLLARKMQDQPLCQFVLADFTFNNGQAIAKAY